jgi:hypothetical protein
MFEDVIVQNEPAAPVYSEHSFVTWRAPLRGADADTADSGRSSATAAKSTRNFFISPPTLSRVSTRKRVECAPGR